MGAKEWKGINPAYPRPGEDKTLDWMRSMGLPDPGTPEAEQWVESHIIRRKTMGKFHANNGIKFERWSDGSVNIYKEEPTVHGDYHDSLLATLSPDTWASIVAHVSAYGEDRLSWETARKFHAGEFVIKD